MQTNNVTDDAKTLTAPERLELLLPWINGVVRDPLLVRERLYAFLNPWADLDAEDAGLRPRGLAHTLNVKLREQLRRELFDADAKRTLRRLDRVRADLSTMLVSGTAQAFPSLTFTVYQRSDRERHVAVNGDWRDVVLYQVMRLLTDPGMALLARCPAPAPGDWKQHCNNWFVTHGRRRGRSSTYCSATCRIRAHRASTPHTKPKPKATKRRKR